MAYESLLAVIHRNHSDGARIEEYDIWIIYLLRRYDSIVEIITQFRVPVKIILHMLRNTFNPIGKLENQIRKIIEQI